MRFIALIECETQTMCYSNGDDCDLSAPCSCKEGYYVDSIRTRLSEYYCEGK